MAEDIKVLGQSAPAAATPTDLYTVPALHYTVISSIVICNRAGAADTIRLAIRVAGAVITDKDYIYYDTPVPANDTLIWTGGVTLDTTDVVTVRATNGTCSFSTFGSECDG